ncbi:MAG: heat-inducible transcriptional repressor HrcA [Clostridiales bacterium]|nr:heat-inducible transcriptional repressor HrcA [Clostridiales bacterium]
MDLNDRKKLILQAIIDEYIGSAEPVGSRAVSKRKELGISSATIRNEMADLEEMGYLIQPHTSAGRIPSDAGYRFYVNSLMKRYKMGVEAIEQLQQQLAGKIGRLDRAIRRAGFLASALTDYTTVISAPVSEVMDIKKVDLVPIAEHTVMLIIVTRTVRNSILKADLDVDECEKLAAVLNEKIRGKTADEINLETINEIQLEACQRLGIEPKVLINVMHYIYEAVSELDDTEIYVENAKSILKYPEYRDIGKAQEMFSFLEDKSKVKQLMAGTDSDGVRAKIGTENENEILKDCSLVTVNYSLDGKAVGKLGVIGPKRMNYEKVFASLDLISNEINKLVGYITTDDS